MTDAASEFMGQDQAPAPKADQPVGNSGSGLDNLLAAITNSEGKQKYSSPEAALLALAESQRYIATLEAENATNRELATKAKSMEELIQRLGEGKQPDQVAQLKPQEIEQVARNVLRQEQLEQQARHNKALVMDTLTKRFGEKTSEALASRAAELGLSAADLGQMAARAPAAVLEFFKESAKAPAVHGTVNPNGLNPPKQGAEPPKDLFFGGSFQDAARFWGELRTEVEQETGLSYR